MWRILISKGANITIHDYFGKKVRCMLLLSFKFFGLHITTALIYLTTRLHTCHGVSVIEQITQLCMVCLEDNE